MLPAFAFAGIRAEVSAEVGDDGIAKVRQKVLSSALTEALKTVVNRHLPSDLRQSRELSPIFKNVSKYINRYKIEAEGQRLERYRLSVVAQVNEKLLLAKLEELGFEPSVLGARPRVLTSSATDEDSVALAALVTKRFPEEKIPATYYQAPEPVEVTTVTAAPSGEVSPGAGAPSEESAVEKAAEEGETEELVFEVGQAQIEGLSARAFARGHHIACSVTLLVAEPEVELDGADGEGAASDELAKEAESRDELPAFMQFLPPVFEVDEDGELIMEDDSSEPPEEEVEFSAGGYIVDALGGRLLGKHTVTAKGRGPDPQSARQDALKKLGHDLYQRFLADLHLARWTPPGEDETLEIRLEEVGSPSLIEPVADVLEALTELDNVSLSRIEPGAVVWSATGRDPGFGWAVIASQVAIANATVEWSVVLPQGALDAPLGASAVITPQPKVLLGRFVTP
jgi:hypothetical protein